MSDAKECVKVVVRCRPLNEREKTEKSAIILQVDEKNASVSMKNPEALDEPPKTFTFDATFSSDSTQAQVYQKTAQQIVEAVLDGYNGTVFAYGQTGSGKTFSMQGILGNPELQGIIPNAFSHIFAHISTAPPEVRHLVRVSYLEIYNEEIRDLLTGDGQKLEIKESAEKSFYVKGLSSIVVKDKAEMDKLMESGNKNRSVAATLMNATSSRSHAMFTVAVEMAKKGEDGEEHVKMGKLHLVDLAGSERQSKTGATGDRLKEGAKINLSLAALGNVISALVEGKGGHIPYRDSKLTRLLQDSLGGNSKTMMLAALSPASYNYEETLSTLRYANRAKQIKNKPKINEDPKDAMLREYQSEIEKLRKQLEMLESGQESGEAEDEGEEAEGEEESEEGGQSAEKPAKIPKKSITSKPIDAHGMSDEKLKELQTQIEKEKSAIMESTAMAETEKQTLLKDLSAKAADLQKEREEREALAQKLAQMEAQLLVGGVNLVDQKEIQELELRRQEAELEEQKRLEREYQRKLEENEEAQLKIEGSYSSLQEEVNAKNKKLKKLWSILMKHKAEVKDLRDEHQRETEGILHSVKELASELQRLTIMAQLFIPEELLRWIESNSTYDQETGSWILPDQNVHGKQGDPPRKHRHPQQINVDSYTHPLFDLRDNIFPAPFLSLEAFTTKPIKPSGKSKRKNTIPSSKDKNEISDDSSQNIPQARGLVYKSKHYA